MNIEEERKAFKKALSHELREENAWLNDSMSATRTGQLRIMERGFFEIWCLAKAHAEEMAKPVVRVAEKAYPRESTSYPYTLCLFEGGVFNGVLEDFRTKADAEQWAKDNGYRVVGE